MGSRGHYISPVEDGRGGPLLYDDREMARQRIVIVGASVAGATAAATLRDEGFDGEIQLIGAEAQLPYNRPPLSKGYLRRAERFEDQLVKPAGYYPEQRIELRLGTRARAVDATPGFVEG